MIYDTLQNYGDVLEVKDIQEILKVGKNQAYALVSNGEIKSIKLGKVYKIPKLYLLEFLYGTSVGKGAIA